MFFGAVAVGLIASILGDLAARRSPLFAIWWYGAWAVLSTGLSAVLLAQGQWKWALWMAICAGINGAYWWHHWNRRKRKRAAALVGAKSRARIDAMVRKVRERAAPRRVLRPVPGGVR